MFIEWAGIQVLHSFRSAMSLVTDHPKFVSGQTSAVKSGSIAILKECYNVMGARSINIPLLAE
jgi:hypothetical protein